MDPTDHDNQASIIRHPSSACAFVCPRGFFFFKSTSAWLNDAWSPSWWRKARIMKNVHQHKEDEIRKNSSKRKKGWGGGGKYEQYCKFASRNRQNRQKSEADNEADQGCHVTRAKDEQSIPSTDYSTMQLSVRDPRSWCTYLCSHSVADQNQEREVHDRRRVTKMGAQELSSYHRLLFEETTIRVAVFLDSRANIPSSSSLRDGAGNGAPGSCVGRLT